MFVHNPVAADDPRMPAVYDNFRRNLLDICHIARRERAPVVLSTVAVNLGDCPPFASLHRPGLSTEELAQWESMCKAGGELEAGNSCREALQQYQAAAKIDDRFAELQFRIARCLSKAGSFAEARERFELARDLDVLRFRADSRINAVIRQAAGEEEAAGVLLADAERALAQGDPEEHGILGERLFYEHVHLTFDGNYLLARAVFEQVCRALPQLGAAGSQQAIPSRQRCAELLALSPCDEYNLAASIGEVTSRAPFTNQLDHDLRQDAARRQRDGLLRQALTPQAIQAARRTYEAALAQSPDDWYLHCHFARLAMTAHRPDVAVEHYRIALGMVPGNASMQHYLGHALAAKGEVDEAVACYRRALEISPDFAEAHYNLGVLLAGRGQADEAVAHYRRALEINPDLAEAHYNLGVLLAGRGQVDEAMAHYRRALEINPGYLEAHLNLGVVLFGRGEVDDAVAHYRKALEINPDCVEAHCNLGNALAGCGQVEEALAHYEKAVGLASAQHNSALADDLRAQIARLQAVAPAGKPP
jgi:tetratricopeptide (TPR) repeat protein